MHVLYMTDFKLKPIELKVRNKYSKLVVFPPYMRQMLAWDDSVKLLDVTLKGNSITLKPIFESVLEIQQTHIKQPKPHESKEQQEEKMLKVVVKNDTKKTVKLEKKKRA